MPKVSTRYLEERKSEIVDAAEACFLRRGFHQCTMQDICRESGLSPGAVYRYFKSKSDIIAAVIGRSTERQAALIEDARASYSEAVQALGAIGEHFFGRLEREGTERVGALELEVWGEALRNEELRATHRRQFRLLSTALSELFRLAVEQAGIESPTTNPRGLAHLSMAIFNGLQLYGALFPQEVNVREVWGEALRNEELRATHRRQFHLLSTALSELFRLAVEQAGIESPTTNPRGLAHLSMAIFNGLQLYGALFPQEVNVREVLESLSLLLQARLAESQTRSEAKPPAAATGVS